MTMKKRDWFFAAFISVAIFAAGLLVIQTSPGIAGPNPIAFQMMGGRMGHQGMRGMMNDNVPPGIKPKDLPDPGGKGAKLTVRYCMQCHNLPSPAMHTAKEWKTVAEQMFRKMSMASGRSMMGGGVSTPSPRQQNTILVYLQAHALKPASSGLASSRSAGAEAFRSSCSECHALPDPKLHSAVVWCGIVRKMQSYARQMGKQPISDQQARAIDAFLTGNARH